MTVPRSDVYIYATWLSKLLAGLSSCEWAAWFKSHYTGYTKANSDFDFATWRSDHHKLLRQTQNELFNYRGTTLLEDQCFFRLKGKSGITLAGKPDLIHFAGNIGTICDVKTGQPRESDQLQVMTYMWALPIARKEFHHITFDGLVVYADQQVAIPAKSIDTAFISQIVALIQRIGAAQPPPHRPSWAECNFCDISSIDCQYRFEAASEDEAVADF
jgi:hypothetical protein